jgi:hypothetical protein
MNFLNMILRVLNLNEIKFSWSWQFWGIKKNELSRKMDSRKGGR